MNIKRIFYSIKSITRTASTSTAHSPTTTQEWMTKGNAHWNNGNIQEALNCFKNSNTSDAFYNQGNCYYSLGNMNHAMKAWRNSIELDKTRSDAHVNLANIYALHEKNPQMAQTHYQEALKLTPEDGQVHYNYAVVLDSLSNLEDAIKHYQLARKYGIEMAEKNLRNAMVKFMASKKS